MQEEAKARALAAFAAAQGIDVAEADLGALVANFENFATLHDLVMGPSPHDLPPDALGLYRPW
jgi:hypothetical protein